MAVLTARLSGLLRKLAGACAAAAACLVCGASAAADNPSLEYAVKANFLYKFGPFVEWPPRVFPTPSAPFIVCVLGEDPFGPTLDTAVRGQTVHSRSIAVRRVEWASRTSGCHVLYIGRSGRQSPSEAVEAVKGAPILTVTDSRSAEAVGIIHLMVMEGRIRFAIDAQRARANGLAISSKLLALAAPRPHPEGS